MAAVFVCVWLEAAAGPAAAANCTTSHCANIQVVISQLPTLGSGTVTSSDGSIHCVDTAGVTSGTCSEKVTWPLGSPTTTITLTATPAVGSLACYSTDGVNYPCGVAGQAVVHPIVLLNGANASALFMFKLDLITLIVSMAGTGTGTVLGNSVVVSCPAGACGLDYNYGQVVNFTTTSITGAFTGWGGACAGQGPVCTLAMTTTRRITAFFELPAATGTPSPRAGATATPTRSGTGSGSGTSRSTPTTSQRVAGTTAGSTEPVSTQSPSAQVSAAPSISAAASADPIPTAPSSTGGTPWLPIILLVVLLLVGVNLMIFQVLRRNRPGA